VSLARPVDADEPPRYWRSRRDSPPDLHHSQPAGARVPPGTQSTGAMGSSRQAGPVQSVHNPDRPTDALKGTGGTEVAHTRTRAFPRRRRATFPPRAVLGALSGTENRLFFSQTEIVG
jgi:hypothetical protein